MGIENELSQICAMIESGKLCYADAVYYLNLMRKKYGIWEKEFRQICDVWSQKGELSGELDRHRDRAEDEAGLYQRVLDGLYEMVELGEITLEMMTENLWEDAYETNEKTIMWITDGLHGAYWNRYYATDRTGKNSQWK